MTCLGPPRASVAEARSAAPAPKPPRGASPPLDTAPRLPCRTWSMSCKPSPSASFFKRKKGREAADRLEIPASCKAAGRRALSPQPRADCYQPSPAAGKKSCRVIKPCMFYTDPAWRSGDRWLCNCVASGDAQCSMALNLLPPAGCEGDH